jgi:hypothetical protein
MSMKKCQIQSDLYYIVAISFIGGYLTGQFLYCSCTMVLNQQASFCIIAVQNKIEKVVFLIKAKFFDYILGHEI